MRATERLVAASQLLLICPAVLFMGSLVVRNLSPLQNEPAHTAQQIVIWYAGRMWTLWVLLIALPVGVLVTGCIMFARKRSKDVRQPKAAQQILAAIHANRAMLIVAVMTLTAGAILTIVVLHMLAN
jgi:Mn2+/Fe2+ NRAMP family transporter